MPAPAPSLSAPTVECANRPIPVRDEDKELSPSYDPDGDRDFVSAINYITESYNKMPEKTRLEVGKTFKKKVLKQVYPAGMESALRTFGMYSGKAANKSVGTIGQTLPQPFQKKRKFCSQEIPKNNKSAKGGKVIVESSRPYEGKETVDEPFPVQKAHGRPKLPPQNLTAKVRSFKP